MGLLFYSEGTAAAVPAKSKPSDNLLHELQCRVCPLNHARLHSPKMPASGSERPLIYIIGEAPGEVEDDEGTQFVGPSGQFLRPLIPSRLRSKIRYNNTIRCHPKGNRDPDRVEVECCRPSIEKDIERANPVAIFGLGAAALRWAGMSSVGSIELWRGRRFPLKIGKRTFWFYPMHHPSFILHGKRNSYKTDDEITFEFDIRRAIAEVEAGLPEPVVHTEKFARSNITCITGRSGNDRKYVIDFLEHAGRQDAAGTDYETQNLRPYKTDSAILTAAVSIKEETLAFAIEHREAGWSSTDSELLREAWIKFLKSKAKKVVFNAAFEMEWSIFFYGRNLAREVPWECVQVQAFVLDERVEDQQQRPALSLEFGGLQYFGIDIKKLTLGLKKDNMKDEPLDKILPYNGIDGKYHLLQYLEQQARIEAEGLVEVYQEKLRQTATVVLTQLKGVPVDAKENQSLTKEYGDKIKEVVQRIAGMPEVREFQRLTGQPFNPASTDDVVVMLRDVLKTEEGREEGKGKKKSKWSTTEAVLKRVDHPVTDGVLDHRKVTKLKSTYVDPLARGSDTLYPGDVLHTVLSICRTTTGRLASSDPNIQNIPVRTPEGRRARRQICSEVVVSLDYGQIDARLIACGSRDKYYCKALWENYDVHAEWARRLALRYPAFVGGKKGLSDDKAMKDFRQRIKSIWVFALFYGAALRTTAQRLGVDEDVLRPLYDEFWKQFADVKVWQESVEKQYEEYGYVQLFDGLRRHAPLGHGQRINTGIQMNTNRVVMHGMNRLSETEIWQLQANMQIHDDLTFCFEKERDYEDNIERIIDTMLDARVFDWICVPLVVEIKDGPTWADLSPVGDYASHQRLNWPIRAREFM